MKIRTLALLTVALGGSAMVAGQTVGSDTSDVSERVAPSPIRFGPCPEDPKLECGVLRVPVYYEHPGDEAVDIAVIRVRATGPGRRIGVLLTNPGGPGGSGIDFVLQGLQLGVPIIARLRERFDLVSFDPRGSGRSRPVHCKVASGGDPTSLPKELLAAFFDDFGRRLANACQQQNGPYVLTLSTNNTARDMDLLRRALGESQITYAGFSYGTVLGSVYASLFPKRLRAMLLDAAFPPEFRDNWIESVNEQSAAFELAFRRLDQICRADTACPLRVTGAVAALDTIMERLAAVPATAPDGSKLTGILARNVVADRLYFEAAWPAITSGLSKALAGDYTFFFQNVARTRGRIRLAINETEFDAYDAWTCNDQGSRRTAATYLSVDEASAPLFPHFFGRFYLAAEVARCSSWPQADLPVIRNVQGRLANPILMLGNDFDPATPLNWTRRLSHALGSEGTLVRYQGGGHGIATGANPCVDNIVYSYLVELNIPSPGSSCKPPV